ncbi:hypothetical protein [Aquimarina mytili]|uniref:Uncharacterized protein n=1 Tax=Aquimarina mytili TaxID=874423 RepID=A0A936ZRQ2_9FLAO|nr:hypothetical protein [Aquimarina mytili]MBL0684182.1 hypothetical protein [Aquimarina mytili]
MKNTRTKFSHRVIAVFFTLTFLQTLIPYNQLWANNNGPKSPEAGAFEPVDATDMVNLLTGDLSYVLPLLNVPSPEGGYPLALSYHAGIAMDQEASWVGLGWNLNPGAINRTVHGFADDYNSVKFYEFFYDIGGSESIYNLSVGYGSPEGNFSAGLGFSWGTNKTLGGSVSFGFGPKIGDTGFDGSVTLGTNGASVGVGFTPAKASNLSFGVSASTSGLVTANAGYKFNSNSIGISINSSGDYTFNMSANGKNASLGINYSNVGGVGIKASANRNSGTVRGAGVNLSLGFNNTVNQGDLTVKTSSYNYGIAVPTPYGTFSASFGKQKIRWNLNKTKLNRVIGPLHFDKFKKDLYIIDIFPGGLSNFYTKRADTYWDAVNIYNEEIQKCWDSGLYQSCAGSIQRDNRFMDIYEFPLENETFTYMDKNNAVFPSMDSYNVQAQGISGTMSLKYFENANLFSLAKNYDTFYTFYTIDENQDILTDDLITPRPQKAEFTFENRPEFYFENEFASYLGTTPASFNSDSTNENIVEYHQSSDANGLPRRKVGNTIEYFTNEEVFSFSNQEKYARGYIAPRNLYQIPNRSPDGIGAFTIVGMDGKRYHYSLPVYNYASVTRSFGFVENKEEHQAYHEKVQDNPYATHWLLTAVTGADYIDMNSNGKVDESDYGYWVEFDYGKWSEAYAWKSPYGKDYIESNDNEEVKTRIEGFKDVYYLDQVKTRTHTAIFSKSVREDDLSHEWKYSSVDWKNAGSPYTERFVIPKQKSLKLNQIILLKNEDAREVRKNAESSNPIVSGVTNVRFPSPNSVSRSYSYNLKNSVFDIYDIPEAILDKAVKVINMRYNNTLVKQTPNASSGRGRLTLNSVQFNGKKNENLIPPYKFEYYNESDFNLDNKNDWGYNDTTPWDWSLKKIITPQGGSINVKYESDDYHKPALQMGKLFTRELQFTFLDAPPPGGNPSSAPEGKIRIKIEVDPEDPEAEGLKLSDHFTTNDTFFMDMWYSAVYNPGSSGYDRSSVDIREKQATITELNRTENYMIVEVMASSPNFRDAFQFDASPFSYLHGGRKINVLGREIWLYGTNDKHSRYDLAWRRNGDGRAYSAIFRVIGNKEAFDQKEGDIRVNEISVTDGVNSYKTRYYYNQEGYNEDPNHFNYRSSGAISYIPNDDNSPIPYSAELPAPKVMYEFVRVKDIDNSGAVVGTTMYQFNVLKDKDPNKIKFGDFLEIDFNEQTHYNTSLRGNVSKNEIVVHDNLGSIGQLLEKKTYNKEYQLVSVNRNEYYERNDRPNNQGMDQQSYQLYKKIGYWQGNEVVRNAWAVNSSSRIKYAPGIKSSTTISGNFSKHTTYDAYDDITGATLQTTTRMSDQTQVRSKVIPAFRKYDAMGSKVDNSANKNMLAQTAANITQINKEGTWKTIAANISTWNNEWSYQNDQDGTTSSPADAAQKIWRKHKTYTWKGNVDKDGAFIGYTGEDDAFNWGANASQTNTKWINTSTVSLYDHFSMPLEVTDINENRVSTKMGDNQSKVIATANAKYNHMFYSGAEYFEKDNTKTYLDGGVSTLGNVVTVADAHTGNNIVSVNNAAAFEVKMPADQDRSGGSEFKVSVWVRKGQEGNVSLRTQNGTSFPLATDFNDNERLTAGDWVLLNGYVTVYDREAIVTVDALGATELDDFRIHPVESAMTSYVYNEWDELTHILGGNNLATKYEYDSAGRLIKTFKEVIDVPDVVEGGFKDIEIIDYNYKK